MTLGICLRCGHDKVGAFTPCPGCGYDPSGDALAQAKALLLSDHHATLEDLRAAAAAIRAGEDVPFDAATLEHLATTLARSALPTKLPIGCAIAGWTPVAVMVLFVMSLVLLWLRL